jgi:hypothetical protein
MASQVTVIERGHVPLTPEIQQSLGIPDGTQVSLTIKQGSIIVTPLPHDPIRAMRELFAGAEYSLEDDLIQMRREEEEHSLRKLGW